jgi:hypothetical protein
MRKCMSRRPRYADVTATVALVVALGGTSYAVTALPRNSVGTAQLKAHSVTKAKLAAGLGVRGREGLAGPPGPPGPPGAMGQTGLTGISIVDPSRLIVSYGGQIAPAPGTEQTTTATCPAGYAISGGYYNNGIPEIPTVDLVPLQNARTMDGRGWTVTIRNTGTTSPFQGPIAVVFCAV